ncbi:HD-GYP domain-containing protein [Candidatus Contubernalis alkaliaceticus]|uniref:HD-GYP domain-containing protein n=1 Tax=Candidatus Contubernalis alkaliaceticus TaxID=338645 RepID=UPI001F4C01CD|nr:HD-GYP domain-containing protein [Candidatus Contubernalis alkalaceticus]UNC91626.1 HD-GYP domain-containing protein [Candidatus Contubernalis alkalaceticus]
MRRISLDSAQPGMVLGKTISGSAGQVLLHARVKIKPQYLTYLKRLGVNYIYVEDSRMDDVVLCDVISEDTRREACSLIKDCMKEVKSSKIQKKGLNVKGEKILQTVSKIVEELLDNKEMLAQLMDIRCKDDYKFAHSVNCCVLATLVAVKMKYDTASLKSLATGALLHDIGLAAVPENILQKPGDLTNDEYETIKNHPFYGYEIFKKTSFFSSVSGAIILQHHERYQGKGYPQGLRGKNINPLAQILAVADVYDALTSDRPYRKAFQPHQAVEMLFSWGGELFDLNILNHFLANIAAYPVGFHVFLNNGESGLVIANTPGFTLRPVVRILYTGEDLASHPAPYDIDLSRVLDLTIVKVKE